MENQKCKLCNIIFSSKYTLQRHLNKPTKCNNNTEFRCDKCGKCFKFNKNLKEHLKNDICNKKNVIFSNNQSLDDDIKNILLTNDDTIFYLKALGVVMEEEVIKKIIDGKLPLATKISLIKSNINNTPTINNNNSNNTINTTNNIQINSFGNEKTDYLTNEYFAKLLQNNYGKDSFLKLSNEIYLNKDKPENNTIKIDNLNNKWCKIIENNKWITTTKDSAKEKIFSKVSDIILLILDDVKDKVPKEKRKIIADFLEKDADDEYIKGALKPLFLKIYNYTVNEMNT
jgi:uncharacterized C2H2 Zn-finger protein